MLYQEYKQRLAKYLNVFDTVWRFRYLVLLAFVLLIALIGVFLGITGNLYDLDWPETFEYGAAFPEARAVFREASLEFCAAGTADWTEEVPKTVGSYAARPVSTGITGGKKVGDPISFSIVPKKSDVIIDGGSFAYGETPRAALSLAYNDRPDGEWFDYEWGTGRTCLVTAHVRRILNENGLDVTTCYDLVSAPHEVNVIPRPVTVSTESASKTYDGSPLSAEKHEIAEGTLASGDSLEVTFPVSRTDAGESENLPGCAVFASDGTDMTRYYEFTFLAGTLNVLPRPLFVETGSATWICDGEPHSLEGAGDYTADGLVNGHETYVTDATTVTEITDTETEVGYRENRLVLGVRDGDGNDVTDNYEFSYRYGRLRVKTEIQITVYRISKIYDGTPLMFEEEDFQIVRPPDVAVRLDLSEFSLTEAGSVPLRDLLRIPVFAEDSETGADVREENRVRFMGNEEEPVLEVMKRRIEVTSISISKKMGGNEPVKGWDHLRPAWITFGTLAPGQRIEIEVTGILYPGDRDPAENTISSVKIYDSSGADVTHNYDIALNPGTLQWI